MIFRQPEPRPVKVHIVGTSVGNRIFAATAFVPEDRGDEAVARIYRSLAVR